MSETTTIPATVTVGDPCRLDECPPGPFMFEGRLCGFKSEYQTRPTLADAYVMESGEFFWGGTHCDDDRAALIVRPVTIWMEAK